MVKMYTLDEKLLTNTPEIRIGDEVFPVDDRKSTVDKIMKMYSKEISNEEASERMQEAMELALGKKAVQKINNLKINDKPLSWAAYNEIFNLVLAAATGENPEKVKERFQQEQQEQ